MAWRIDESVIRGEIDNRVRGRVTGRVWFVGREAPVEFDLTGNAWRDLAGRRLEFVNPDPKPGDLKGLGVRQTGVIGDCTASRKVRVPEVSLDELMNRYEQRKPFPWHWGNSLYLEWFGTANGRVVIESAAFQLTISPDIAWDMTSAEEATQRGANAEAMRGFMTRLGEAIVADRAAKGGPVDDTPPEWNEEPQAGDPAAEGDEERVYDEEAELAAQARPRHPLAERAFEAQLRFRKEAEQRGWVPAGASDEHPVVDLVMSVCDGARKISGALGRRDWPPPPIHHEDAIERLRRARGCFDHALLAAAYCEQQKLVTDAAWLAGVQREINVLAYECNKLIAELLARPDEGQ